jgi:uncharacterized protein YjlB
MDERPGPRWHRFADDGRIPNNQRLDVLVYPQTLGPEAAEPAAAFEELFGRHGWPAAWRDGVYPFAHYHSVCHEALGIARGRARLRLGGESGIELEVGAGDVLVLPAGTGHQNLGSSPDLLVVGAYPEGSDYDLCRADAGERAGALERIARVPLPLTDPIEGAEGTLVRRWTGRDGT